MALLYRIAFLAVCAFAPALAAAVADGVYAHISDKGPRRAESEGMNANLGLVVTSAGAVLIDSGATLRSARQIHDAAKRVTSQPLGWVVNTGVQDHRWLGNGYFAGQGVDIIAHAKARADMTGRGSDRLQGLEPSLGAKADSTVPTLAMAKVDTQAYRLALRAQMMKAVDDGADVNAAVESFDAAPFMRLLNAAELMPGNANRTYLELERE